METPKPIAVVSSEEENLKATRRVFELKGSPMGSIDEAVRFSLQDAMDVWKARLLVPPGILISKHRPAQS